MGNCICEKHKDELSALSEEELMSKMKEHLESNLRNMEVLQLIASEIEKEQKILDLLQEEMERRLEA